MSSNSTQNNLSLQSRCIRFAIRKDEMGLPLREVQKHLSEVTVSPREPRAGIVRGIINVDRFMDQTKATGILSS